MATQPRSEPRPQAQVTSKAVPAGPPVHRAAPTPWVTSQRQWIQATGPLVTAHPAPDAAQHAGERSGARTAPGPAVRPRPQGSAPQAPPPQAPPHRLRPYRLRPTGSAPTVSAPTGSAPTDSAPQAPPPQTPRPQALPPQALRPQALCPQTPRPQSLRPQALRPGSYLTSLRLGLSPAGRRRGGVRVERLTWTGLGRHFAKRFFESFTRIRNHLGLQTSQGPGSRRTNPVPTVTRGFWGLSLHR